MIGLIITLATITSYFAIGFTWSKRMLPKWWEIAREDNAHWFTPEYKRQYTRGSVKSQYFWKAVAWPFFALFGLDSVIDKHDPERIKKENDSREQRIRDLERELGIR